MLLPLAWGFDQQVLREQESAIELFYEQTQMYVGALHRTLRRISRDPKKSDDLAQDGLDFLLSSELPGAVENMVREARIARAVGASEYFLRENENACKLLLDWIGELRQASVLWGALVRDLARGRIDPHSLAGIQLGFHARLGPALDAAAALAETFLRLKDRWSDMTIES